MLKEVTVACNTVDEEDTFFLGAVSEGASPVIEQQDAENEWLVKLPVNGSTVEFKIDTGADITVISQTAFKRLLQSPRLVTIKKKSPVISPGGEVQCIGKFLATSVFKGQKYQYWITVIKGPYSHNLLGGSVAKRMGLVRRIDGIDTDMLSDVFGDIGLLKCDPVKIELKADAEPYTLTSPCRIPFPLLSKVEAELKRMLA